MARSSCTRSDASTWIRGHMPTKDVVRNGRVLGNKVVMTQARLRKWLRRRDLLPRSVRQHVWAWYRYRQRRGYAN